LLSRGLRLAVTCLCVAAVAVAPAGAGGGPGQARLGGAANETASSWFVELASPPAVKGTSKATLRAEQDAFKKNAAADGINLTERYSYDTLWNGLSVSVPATQVAALGSVPGVKAVYPVESVSLPAYHSEGGGGANIELKNALGLTGANVAQDELGLDGTGVTIAIVDSGVDYTLPELGGCFGPSCKVRGGLDLVGNDYNATATSPAYQPVPHPGGPPLPCNPDDSDRAEALGAGTSNGAHGTHVAGIAAADGRGHTDEGEVVGVAPGAKLLAYKVFGCNGSTGTDVMIHAMELALTDNADVVNISIGSAFDTWPESPAAVAADNLVDAGVVVVASIGNSGANFGQLWSAGAPGVGNKVIGVASYNNTKATLPAFRVGTNLYTYMRASGSLANAPDSGSAELVATGTPTTVGDGCVNAPAPGSLTGKIALIRRGSAPPPAATCGFYNKAINAQRAGAVGVVIYNNVAGALNPTVTPTPAGAPPVTIPVVAITQADGEEIYSGLASDDTLTWTDQILEAPLATAGVISDFSSFGTDAELGLKPDLGGPGGQIYSTWPHQQFGGHNTISGTSMAAPHIAGLAALIIEAKNKIAPGLVRTLLMNTASPRGLNISPDSGLEPTWRQGAGLAQIVDAVTTPSWVTPSKISLGEGSGGSAQLAVTNSGSAPITYDLSGVTTIGTGPSTTAGAVYPFNFAYLGGTNTTTFSAPTLAVPAGGTATVGVTVQAGAWPDKSLYGGYIVLTPRGGGVTLRVPYVGFKGDYQSLPVLTGASCGLPAVFQIKSGGSDGCLGAGIARLGAAGGTFTLQGSDFPILLFHLNHQARRLNIQVYKADGSPVQPVYNYAVQTSFLGRNSTPTSFFEFDWDGTRSQDNGGGNGDHRKALPNGRYLLKLSVLKALGNPANAADWETFTTPPITIART
jgi:minor extracellular serine protease Vpr